MAPRKNAKKQPEAPKVNIGAEIFASLRELEKINLAAGASDQALLRRAFAVLLILAGSLTLFRKT